MGGCNCGRLFNSLRALGRCLERNEFTGSHGGKENVLVRLYINSWLDPRTKTRTLYDVQCSHGCRPRTYLLTIKISQLKPSRLSENGGDRMIGGSNVLSKWQEAWKQIHDANESNYEAALIAERCEDIRCSKLLLVFLVVLFCVYIRFNFKLVLACLLVITKDPSMLENGIGNLDSKHQKSPAQE